MPRVLVIGAGASGLAAVKACLEEGVDVVCIEKTSDVGGLWTYREKNVDGVASIMYSTTTNTSKDLSAFSDFPPPPDFPNYMHNSLVARYLHSYADAFGLKRHVRCSHVVLRLSPASDHEQTGCWDALIQDVASGKSWTESFDAAMVCTGYDVAPVLPSFPGLLDRFRGRVLHTRDYKRPAGFEGKRVLVVGLGNSGADVAVELSAVADSVYVSTRRGCWTIPRVGPRGEPFDTVNLRRVWNWLFHLLPFGLVCHVSENEANARFDHAAYNLAARHRIHEQHATISDLLPSKILNGTVVVKGNVLSFTEDAVLLEDDPTRAVPVDVVVLATGYGAHFPFIDSKLVPVRDNRLRLYKFVFPPHLKRHTLAFIGGVQPEGSLFPISELQSRWAVGVFVGRYALPGRAAMDADVDLKERHIGRRYIEGSRHARQVDWIDYMDEVAELVGCRPRLLRLLFTDPKLLWACVFGPCLPYQYRLHGPRPWPMARQEILSFQENYKRGLKTREVPWKTEGERRSFVKLTLMVLSLVATAAKVKIVREFLVKYATLLWGIRVKVRHRLRLGKVYLSA
ncbi:hypothetical protein HPB47_006272 [Ixodes persulcatus]|uniref:Uncharacterized protein n=1 Tax=Ixodes persulcatus TaxID=34615 RepID=A0AC60PAU0_IXOPE|nr:hypothetical protein HPB47_006272 [Ixodes persulcatus]